ncbi:hypothetical protein ABQE42_21860, partial [Mycolicibacterium pulveris]
FGTVQTESAEVISVKNVSRNDHGQITAAFSRCLCRSPTMSTDTSEVGGQPDFVSQFTMIL